MSLRYFYSCIASVVGLNIALFLSVRRINWDMYPDGLPAYANAMENIFFRLPVWLLSTFLLAVALLLVSEWKIPFQKKAHLLGVNTVVWIVFQALMMGAYWLTFPSRSLEMAFSFPAILLLRLLK